MSESISDTSSVTSSDKASVLSSATPHVLKLGELFERKRRENKWTKQYVAKALLLSVQQIEALENDEYDKLSGTTYVVGYWRSYANLLKIDISESIEFHKNNLKTSPSVIALEAGHHRAHNHQEKARKRSGLVFFILSVMFLAGIWYWQNPDDTPLDQWFDNQPNRETNQSPQTGFSKSDNQVISGEESGQDDFGALPKPNFSDDVTEDVSETDVENEDATTTESVNNGDSQAVSLGQQAQQEQKFENTRIVSPQSSITKNATESLAEIPLPDSPNWIFFSIEKQSWLDVRDVTGEKLIYRIVNVGEVISLNGHPPFYVYVGIADGVRIEYLDKPVRFKSEDSGSFARFRADKSGIKTY